MGDGIYFEIFVIKDGVRYNQNIINVGNVSEILTNSILDGLGKILGVDPTNAQKHTEEENNNGND